MCLKYGNQERGKDKNKIIKKIRLDTPLLNFHQNCILSFKWQSSLSSGMWKLRARRNYYDHIGSQAVAH